MSRLPIIGGDYDSWGTILNDYLTETAGVAVLSTSPSAGATTFDLAVVPQGLQIGSCIAVDAYTDECELRSVTNVSGNTITVSALKYGHAAGDTVLFLSSNKVSTDMYAIATGAAEWNKMQRLVLEAVPLNLEITSNRAVVSVEKPVIFETQSITSRLAIKTHATYGPVDAAGAAVMVANRMHVFTASASTNEFTVAAGHGFGDGAYVMAVDSRVAFFAPYGETLPGSIVAGKIYYIDTVPSPTTFTISATPGGSTFDVTADGAGVAGNMIYELSRVFWEQFYLQVSVADVNGILMSLQQPAWTRHLRIDMQAATTNGAAALVLAGQLSVHLGSEINTWTDCYGTKLTGYGHSFFGYNSVGNNNGDTSIWIQDADNCAIHDIWTEQFGAAGIQIGPNQARGIALSGFWYHSHLSDPSVPALLLASEANSFTVEQIRPAAGGQRLVQDTARGHDLYALGAAAGTDICTDAALVFKGMSQGWGILAPVFAEPTTVMTSSDYTVVHTDRLVRVDTTGADRTISLLDATGWKGWTVTIWNAAGANDVIIDPFSSQQIDGASTLTVAPGASVSLYCTGSDFGVYDEKVP